MEAIRVLAVYAGGPREVALPDGGTTRTALHKQERPGPVAVSRAGIDGDGWGSPDVHGLPDQALCLYPAAHWPALRAALEGARGAGSPATLLPGAFGENLSIDGADETRVRVDSVWRWGGVRMQVTMPRSPCATLTRVHGLPTLVKEVARSGRTGWYCRVLEGGTAAAGEPMVLESEDVSRPTVAEAWRARIAGDDDGG